MARPSSVLDLYPFTDIGRRERQEDYFYTGPPARDGQPWLGVLADGMGGHECGEVASQEGVHAVRLAFEGAGGKGRDVGRRLVDATRQGHEAVLRAAEKAGAAGNMGSTVVAFVVDGPTLHWCSAGDSRLYLFRGGKLVQLTQDFTVAEDMLRSPARGEWSTEEIEASPQRNALTSFMGTDEWRADTGSRALQDQDVVVVCSDGVYGTVLNEGIAAACASLDGRATARQVAEDLQRRVRDAGKSNQDNATAIVLRYGGCVRGGVWSWPLAIGAGAGLVAVAVVVGVLWQKQSSDVPAGPAVPGPRGSAPAAAAPGFDAASTAAASAVAAPPAIAGATGATPAPPPLQTSAALPTAQAATAAPQRPATSPRAAVPAAPPAVTKAAAPRPPEPVRPTPGAGTKKEDEALVKQIKALEVDVERLKKTPEEKGTITPEAAKKRAAELLDKLEGSGLPNQAALRKELVTMRGKALTTRLSWNLKTALRIESSSGPEKALEYVESHVMPLLPEVEQLPREASGEGRALFDQALGRKQSLVQKKAAVAAAPASRAPVPEVKAESKPTAVAPPAAASGGAAPVAPSSPQ